LNLLGRPQRVRAEALPECVEAPAGLWRSHRWEQL